MKKQIAVRTYPHGYNYTIDNLKKYLNEGYIVVMCNPFECRGEKGNEYILEKEIER